MERNKIPGDVASMIRKMGFPYTAKYLNMFGMDAWCPLFRSGVSVEAEKFYKKCVEEKRPWDYFMEEADEAYELQSKDVTNEDEGKRSGDFDDNGVREKVAEDEREDADDDGEIEWITINGAHIPLDDDGKAMAGGDLKGKTFQSAERTKVYKTSAFMVPRVFVDEEDVDDMFGKRPPIKLRRENRDKYDEMRAEYEKSPVKQWGDKLESQEERSIENYVGPEYNGINGLLRGQMTERMVERWNETCDIPVQDMITHIESAIDKFELKEPIKVYRTCEEDLFHSLSRQVGSKFRDDGFVSTTALNEKVASGNVRMEIDVPAGKGIGAYIGSTMGHPEEHEFMLQRGTEFIVRSCDFNRKTGEFLIKLDVVGNTRKDYEYANKEDVIQRWEMLGIDYTDEDIDDI